MRYFRQRVLCVESRHLCWGRVDICPDCMRKVSYVSEPVCLKCGKPVENDEVEYCSDCSRKNMFMTRHALCMNILSASRIQYTDSSITIKGICGIYAKQIADKCGSMIHAWAPDALIPVPIHSSRLKERGFNQAELIAENWNSLLVSLWIVKLL